MRPEALPRRREDGLVEGWNVRGPRGRADSPPIRGKFHHSRDIIGKVRIGDIGNRQLFEKISRGGSEQVVQLKQNEGRFLRRELRCKIPKCFAIRHEINSSIRRSYPPIPHPRTAGSRSACPTAS